MENKTCYVVNFYLGERRFTIEEQKTDRLLYLKMQILNLLSYKHSLSTIIFNFNFREEDLEYIPEIFNLVPKKIQNANVEIHFRKNYGMSYGAWSDAFDRKEDKYDYFIFNEDDYFFVDNSWDQYLIDKFNSFGDCGYLCMKVSEPAYCNNYRKHAGHSTGISSNKVLKDVKKKFGLLPHSQGQDYPSTEHEGQVDQTFCMLELGYNIYDVRDDYRVAFNNVGEINRFHWWNKKDLLNPAMLIRNYAHNWKTSWGGEYGKDHKATTIREALKIHYLNYKKDWMVK